MELSGIECVAYECICGRICIDVQSRSYIDCKSFLFHLGCCNDARMEYELVYQSLLTVTDVDMYDMVTKYVSNRFSGKSVSELNTSEKCSILKPLFFSSGTTVPQLSRILGLPRELIKKMLSQ